MKSAARAPRGTGLKLNQVCEKPCRASARSSCTFRRFDRNSRAEPAERQARMVGCRNSCASVQSPHLAVGRPAKMPHYGPQSRRGSAAREGRTKRGADCGGARPGVGSAPASSSRAETYDPVILPNGERIGTRGDAITPRGLYARAGAGGFKEPKARYGGVVTSLAIFPLFLALDRLCPCPIEKISAWPQGVVLRGCCTWLPARVTWRNDGLWSRRPRHRTEAG